MAGVKLKPFCPANEPTSVPTPGTDGFYPLIATAEPLSAGAPPHLPTLVSGIEFQLPSRVVEDGAGYVVAHAMELIHRPRFTVRWGHLTHEERDDVLEFLAVDCDDGRLAFDLEPDGPGTGVVKVRSVTPAEYAWVGRPAHVVEVEVEQIF